MPVAATYEKRVSTSLSVPIAGPTPFQAVGGGEFSSATYLERIIILHVCGGTLWTSSYIHEILNVIEINRRTLVQSVE